MTLPRLPALATRAPSCAAALALVLPVLAMAQSAPAPTTAPTPQVEPAGAPRLETRTTSLPAKGLFQGDELTPAARKQLAELVLEALGLRIEVALVVPTGPWQLDGSGPDERQLTPQRLEAVKRFLQQRGVDTRRMYVESRIDDKIAEPRLEVQIGGRDALD
jgi:OOP family OmpA-OmpF porin